MEPENTEPEVRPKSPLFVVTPLSKYLAMLLFIVMPFIGGWIGYVYSPGKIVEVESTVPKEVTSGIDENKKIETQQSETPIEIDEIKNWKILTRDQSFWCPDGNCPTYGEVAFELRYPQDWIEANDQNDPSLILKTPESNNDSSACSVHFYEFVNSDNRDIISWWESAKAEIGGSEVEPLKHISISGRDAIKLVYQKQNNPVTQTGTIVSVFTRADSNIESSVTEFLLKCEFGRSVSSEKIFMQMMNSAKIWVE